jgi:hypothetical protein
MMRIHRVGFENRDKYNQALLQFEAFFRYPLGKDYFTINHGDDYFKFFDTLGEPYFFIAKESDEIIGVCVAVLRTIDIPPQEKVWYLCDTKVHPNYQGHGVVQKIFKYAFPGCWKISKTVYAITMDRAGSFPNKMASFAGRIPHLNIKFKGTLEFYLLEIGHNGSRHFVEKNKHRFTSLDGIKNLVLESSGQPVRWMHYAQPHSSPTLWSNKPMGDDNGVKFMVCCPQDSEQSVYFQEMGLQAVSTASIIANFDPSSWDFVKSCDI